MATPGIKKILAALAALALLPASAGGCSHAQAFRGTVVDEPSVPELSGINWDGKDFDLKDLSGKVVVVFFGYTSCPDVCPFSLAKMKQLFAALGDQAEDVSAVFASVDPGRDSVEKLSQYVPNFDPRFYGLHLEKSPLDRATDSFHLTIQYGQPKDGPGTDSFYYVDHTASFFLIDRQGRLRVTFPPNASAQDMEADIQVLLVETAG